MDRIRYHFRGLALIDKATRPQSAHARPPNDIFSQQKCGLQTASGSGFLKFGFQVAKLHLFLLTLSMTALL